jgi:hypothetical protein
MKLKRGIFTRAKDDAGHGAPIHGVLSTAPRLGVSRGALGALPEEGNVMPKHVEATIHN